MRKFLIKVNGSQYEVEVEEIRDGSFAIPAMSIPTVAASAPAAPAAVQPEAPAAAPVAVPAEKPAQAAKPVSNGAVGTVKISAPMPGTILKVVAKPGDKVKKGQVLVILEAMKMENEIVAPSEGIVATINVTSGTSVNAGELLASLN